jgi:hypothetical protein
VAALWQERTQFHAGDPDYTLTISAPANADARAIGTEIRKLRQAKGEVAADQVALQACDQTGASYELPLDIGDRVRIFDRVNASFEGRSRGNIGNNGSVLEVMAIDKAGLALKNAHGSIGKVAWNSLRDRTSGKIRLSYGDVLTIQSAQGATSTEHILAMPAGSRTVDAYTAYTGGSRHRRATYLVTSEGAERKEVASRRPLGDTRLIRATDVWANVARNLSRQAEAPSALSFLEQARQVRLEAVHALQQGLQPLEQRMAEGQGPVLAESFARRRLASQVAQLVQPVQAFAQSQAERLAGLVRFVSTTWQAFAEIGPGIQMRVRQAAARRADDPERIKQRQLEEQKQQEFDAIRARLLQERMAAWRRNKGYDWLAYDAKHRRDAQAREETRIKAEIAVIPEPELLKIDAEWKGDERKRQAEQELTLIARPNYPSPGM